MVYRIKWIAYDLRYDDVFFKVSKAKLREQVTKLLNENSNLGQTNFLADMMEELKGRNKFTTLPCSIK